jgi:hypothetical protein
MALDGVIELPEWLGRDASWAYTRASDILLHQEHGADGQRSIRLIPLSFKVAGFHQDMVSEFILDLGGEQVEAGHPVYCQLARLAAGLVDHQQYSFDFRWAAYEALNGVLASWKRAAADDDEKE